MFAVNSFLLSLFVLCLVAAGPALAGNNSGGAFSTWPATGLENCYDAAGNVMDPCPKYGEPFYGQDAQFLGPVRSYTSLGGGTMVQDNVTGLIWEVKENKDRIADYTNPHDADNQYVWCDTNSATNGGIQGNCDWGGATQDFIEALNNAVFGGHADWRLPTYKELMTLVDYSRYNPAIDTDFFPGTVSSNY